MLKQLLSHSVIGGNFHTGGFVRSQTALFANFTMKKSNRPSDARWVGRTELLNGGRQEMGINVREIELPRETPGSVSAPALQTRKWPGSIATELGAEYFFRPDSNLSYFHMKAGETNEVILSSPDSHKLETNTIENALHESTRGFAVQILFEGRGVRAHLEPEWPHLKVRLGVGGMMKDFTWLCERDPEVTGYLQEKNGTILVIHGPSKARVARIAMGITLANKANPYSGKGAHFAFNPVKKRTPKKKKKGGK